MSSSTLTNTCTCCDAAESIHPCAVKDAVDQCLATPASSAHSTAHSRDGLSEHKTAEPHGGPHSPPLTSTPTVVPSAYLQVPPIVANALFGAVVAYIYSAPPLKLKQSGWIGVFACGASYIALPWWCGQSLLGELTPDVMILTVAYSIAGGWPLHVAHFGSRFHTGRCASPICWNVHVLPIAAPIANSFPAQSPFPHQPPPCGAQTHPSTPSPFPRLGGTSRGSSSTCE